jgi:hypothetical protein
LKIKEIAALGLLAALALAGCAGTGPGGPQVRSEEIAREDLSRTVADPIPVSPFVAKVYREKYLPGLGTDTVGVFALSPNGNRFYQRSCHHPDCGLTEEELAARALDRCNIGVPRQDAGLRCVVFDRSGRILQPHRFWTAADFDFPITNPPAKLVVADPAALAPARYAAMTPDGQLVISLRQDGRAYFWDTGDGFHQGTWSLKDDKICVDSVDQRATVTCGTLYGADPQHLAGVTLDLFPGKYLPLTRLPGSD